MTDTKLKKIELLFGLKAEQSLRDAIREHGEKHPDAGELLELCPIGPKDWMAGERIGGSISFGLCEKTARSVMQKLVSLKSHQRIRRENIRIYAVKPPVPVFKDTAAEEVKEPVNEDGSVTCPVCKTQVHRYNAQYDPDGNLVGCYLCRGESRR